jgi:endo-1,4-beta-xylanase
MRFNAVSLMVTIVLVMSVVLSGCNENKVEYSADNPPSLKETYQDYFPIGAAVKPFTTQQREELILKHFNSLTAENEMKFVEMRPSETTFYYDKADQIVNFAQENDMLVRGHTLIWHSQATTWLFKGEGDEPPTREVMLDRMNNHIRTLLDYYKGKVYAWDVVNEAISDEANEYLRPTQWLDTIGEDYIQKAFEIAHEADPDALLFYNDYSVVDPVKRDKIYKMLKDLLDKGTPIHGIGMQAHWNINWPSAETLEETIELFASLGLEVHITELDVSLYDGDDHEIRYTEPPADLLEKQAIKYGEVFEIFRKHKDTISSVTLWGVTDESSWLNNFPVTNRPNWPLLFNVLEQPKPAFKEVVVFKD